MPDQNTRAQTAVKLHVEAGSGRLTRHGAALLFVPFSDAPADAVDSLIASFVVLRERLDARSDDHTIEPGSNIAFNADASVPFAMVDWTALTSPDDNPWPSGSAVRVIIGGAVSLQAQHNDQIVTGVADQVTDSLVDLDGARTTLIVSKHDHHTISNDQAATDLVAGTIPADAFQLMLSTDMSAPSPNIDLWDGANAAVAPPPFHEVTPNDPTEQPVAVVTWPADDPAPVGDSTHRRPTQRRAAGANSHAVNGLGLLLPGGDVIALDGTAVVGREPDLAVARVSALAIAVRVDAPTTVSRTHLVISLAADGSSAAVTDCGSRGRTALLRSTGAEAEALDAWTPAVVMTGDVLLLGGPTEVAIVSISPNSDLASPLDDEHTLPPGIRLGGQPPHTDSTQ